MFVCRLSKQVLGKVVYVNDIIQIVQWGFDYLNTCYIVIKDDQMSNTRPKEITQGIKGVTNEMENKRLKAFRVARIVLRSYEAQEEVVTSKKERNLEAE